MLDWRQECIVGLELAARSIRTMISSSSRSLIGEPWMRVGDPLLQQALAARSTEAVVESVKKRVGMVVLLEG